jgi:hypothetical protein
MKATAATLLFVFVLAASAACTTGVSWRMVEPQLSEKNHYIGLDMEVRFEFLPDRFKVTVTNTGEQTLLLDWQGARFIGPDGSARKVRPWKDELTHGIGIGAVETAELTVVDPVMPRPRFGHRRTYVHRLVHPDVARLCLRPAEFLLPVARFNAESGGAEVIRFRFAVRPE